MPDYCVQWDYRKAQPKKLAMCFGPRNDGFVICAGSVAEAEDFVRKPLSEGGFNLNPWYLTFTDTRSPDPRFTPHPPSYPSSTRVEGNNR